MKKICFITTVPTTLETFVVNTAEYFHDNTNWDISFICNTDYNFSSSIPNYFHYFPVHMKRGISLAGIKATIEMLKIFKREQFDLVQYSTPNASLYAAIASKLARIPVRLYCQWGIAYTSFTGLKRYILKIVEKMVCSLSTWIEPDSKSNLEFAHSEGLYSKDKGSVIWNGSACGVNLEKFNFCYKNVYRSEIRDKYEIDPDAFVYGYVGRITRDKGINELLSAFQKIFTGKEYLMLVGQEEVDKTVSSELVDWARHSKNVIFVGFTNVVEKYLSAMDCYILPSYREGFGMSVIEAESMGVPVIVTNIPGPVDAMAEGKTGLVVNKSDANDLYLAMNRILIDEDFRKQCEINGLQFIVENFDQKILFLRLLDDRKRLLDLK